MNNSKENILKRIAAAGMPEYAYPDFGYEPQHFDDPAAMFAQRLRAAGGEAVWLDGATTLDEVVRRCYPDAKSVASALPEGATALMVVIPRDALVDTMHEAVVRPEVGDFAYGCFMSGPSKTADIEQALVFGAHGPMSVTVVLR